MAQHFLLSAAARSLSFAKIMGMSDTDVEDGPSAAKATERRPMRRFKAWGGATRAVVASAPGQVDPVEHRAQPGCQLGRVVIGPEVHEEQPWLVVQHVVVQRRDLDAVLA